MPDSIKHLSAQLRHQGYAILPSFLNSVEVQTLLEESDLLVEQAREADAARAYDDPQWAATARGCVFETVGGQHADGAAFRGLRCRCVPGGSSAAACELLFGAAMRELVQAALGVPGVVFNDQYIVKPPQSPASAFPWHRDSDWLDDGAVTRHPYISVWCALHDMTEGNGALVVGFRENAHTMPHDIEQDTLEVSAGTAVVMTDSVWHCSKPNLSAHTRAAWMPQFSAQPVLYRSTGQPVSLAVPLVADCGLSSAPVIAADNAHDI
jgi:hypothetical protein